MDWSREKIAEKVIGSADRFGHQNPQQHHQLTFALKKCSDVVVYEGLLSVFLTEGEKQWDRQHLAGKLLVSVSPNPPESWSLAIRNCLSTYERSVEELPWYLARSLGRDAYLDEVRRILEHDLSSSERQAAETMYWWVDKCVEFAE